MSVRLSVCLFQLTNFWTDFVKISAPQWFHCLRRVPSWIIPTLRSGVQIPQSSVLLSYVTTNGPFGLQTLLFPRTLVTIQQTKLVYPNQLPWTSRVCHYRTEQVSSSGTLLICIFWYITSCGRLKVNRRFGGTCHLHLQGWRISLARNQSGLLFNPEEGNMFLGNVGWFSTDYTALYPRRQNSI
jgi:hypothetical protein